MKVISPSWEISNTLFYVYFLSELLYDRCKLCFRCLSMFEYQIQADVISNKKAVMGMIKFIAFFRYC